ncbi:MULTISPECIES: hypothetical protein [unclassified Saccharicrinis]|uniref:hypothetical protein n=1 Tax=unclassified Saccharicrinis TaxID=2646859 RepID=UPI003D33DEE7
MTEQPINYTAKDLENILNKEVEIGVGDIDDEDIFTFKGKMVGYSVAADNPDLPVDFHFHTDHGAIKHFDFSVLKIIRVL